MSNTDSKIKRATGLLIIEVINSNPNGDPDRESDPRQRPDGKGEISPVSFKRKLRDLVEDQEGDVWQTISQQLGLKADAFAILESRGRVRKTIQDELMKKDEKGVSKFQNKYWDGRVFGNTFLEDAMDKGTIKTGVVQIGLGVSIVPIDIERHTNTNKAGVEDGKTAGMAPMAYRFVQHGVYCMPFFVNPSMAHKSGCTVQDIELFKKLIQHAYTHTRSHARPFVEIRHAWYCEHNKPLGSCSDFAVIDALKPKKKGDVNIASTSWDDYEVPAGLPDDLKNKVECVDLVNF
ncbi:MAG: type I CRISPR-associated protein Cas7, partial [Anaerolineales bacterium]|nr:type I CRISPR-associated protein Cas7 [Anaerolineales bacterium]